jgi:radical SAM family RiPP maturation amino acid epimerase
MKTTHSQVAQSKSKELILNISKLGHLLKTETKEQFNWTEQLSNKELTKEISKGSQIKRLIELVSANPALKEQVTSDIQEFLAHYSLDIESDEVRILWEKKCKQESEKASKNYQSLIKMQSDWAEFILNLADSSSNPKFKAWRKRQISRCRTQLAEGEIGHFPMCFELSKGCSVGCWFCGVSAPRLSDIFFYTPENGQVWRDVLKLMKQLLGEAAGSGFCYWASEPLDNPDYEKFLGDFHEILGVFPQTTTAQPLKNPTRTRSLLKLSLENGCLHNRFSILSLKMLQQLYEEFTPEELAFVGLVLQNKESGSLKHKAGRARKHGKRKGDELFEDAFAGTSACVSGFLFNMVDHTVKLITPCNANDKWLNGYWIYDQATFTDVDNLKSILKRMIDDYMPLTIRPSDRIRFRSDFQYESLTDGFQLSNRWIKLKFGKDPYMKQLGEAILPGNKTAQEIVRLFSIWGVSSHHIFQSLNLLFERGVLEEEPEVKFSLSDEQRTAQLVLS